MTALGAIATALGALKLGEAAANAMKLVNGLKGLGLASGGSAGSAAAGAAGKVAGGGLLKAGLGAAAVPAAVVAAAVTPALIAQSANERKWAEQKEARLTAANSMTGPDKEFLIAAAEALDQHYRLSGDSLNLLMGMQDRGTIEKAQLLGMLAGKSTSYGNNAEMELLRLWESGGEGWDQARTDALLTTITDTYAKMAEATTAITGGEEAQKTSSSEMTAAAGELKGMPALVAQAITNAMGNIKIYIDGQTAGNVITPYVNKRMGGILGNLAK